MEPTEGLFGQEWNVAEGVADTETRSPDTISGKLTIGDVHSLETLTGQGLQAVRDDTGYRDVLL